MKAAWYERTGPASEVLEIGDAPLPELGPRDVLVRIAASGVNPSDVKARAGLRGGASGMPYPRVIPHSDGAGVIEAVGAEVAGRRVGERVFVWNGQWERPFGTAAEFAALPETLTAPLPDDVDFATGAALGIPGATAAHCVFGDGAVAGQSVLIHGGAGTVGLLMVQLAASDGAHVVATVGREEDAARARAAGAAGVALYHSPTLQEDLSALNGAAPFDRIIDVEFGRNIDVNAALIKSRGRIVSYGSQQVIRPEIPFYPLMFKGVRIELALIYLLLGAERERANAALAQALASGALKIPQHGAYPLDQIAKAHEAVEAGGRSGAVAVVP